MDAKDESGQRQASTMDAWLLLSMAVGLYFVSQLLFTKVSLLGGTAAGQVLFMLVPALVYAKWKSGSVKEALRLRPASTGIMWRVALLVLASIGLLDLLEQVIRPVIERYFANYLPVLKALMELLTPKSESALLVNLLIVGLLAPVCEEVLFRGAFQGTLERRGPKRAILTSALVFACVHLNPFNFIGIVLIGIALGYVTWRTQSLWPAILWHVINNSVATLSLYFGGESFSMPLWMDVLMATAFVGLAWEFVRHTSRTTNTNPGPLVTAPALLGQRALRLARTGGLLAAVVLLTGTTCFGRARLCSDGLQPEYTRGDYVIYRRGPAFESEALRLRDVVVYRRADGNLGCSRIIRIEGERITLFGPSTRNGRRPDELIVRKDLIGKVVWKFDPGKKIKGLLRKTV